MGGGLVMASPDTPVSLTLADARRTGRAVAFAERTERTPRNFTPLPAGGENPQPPPVRLAQREMQADRMQRHTIHPDHRMQKTPRLGLAHRGIDIAPGGDRMP